MEYKKSRWENEYDKFLNNNKDELISKMASIRDNLKEGPEYEAKKAELDDIKKTLAKYERIEKNKVKIENILSFKKQLVERISSLLEENKQKDTLNKSIIQLEKQLKKLDEDRQKLIDGIQKIVEQLKQPNLKNEDRQKLEQKKQEQLEKVIQNDNTYQVLANDRDKTSEKLGSYDNSKFDNELLKNEQLISKCDFIGANLVKGKSMEEISASLNNFKFTPNKDFAKKIQAMREMYGIGEKVENKEANKEKHEPEMVKEHKDNDDDKEHKDNDDDIIAAICRAIDNINTPEEEPIVEPEGQVPSPISEFDQKHPRLAKVKNFFKEKYKAIKERLPKFERKHSTKPTINEPVNGEEPTIINEEPEIKSNSDFEYALKHLNGKDDDKVLTEITEKGVSEFRKNMKVENLDIIHKNRQSTETREARETLARQEAKNAARAERRANEKLQSAIQQRKQLKEAVNKGEAKKEDLAKAEQYVKKCRNDANKAKELTKNKSAEVDAIDNRRVQARVDAEEQARKTLNEGSSR